MAKYIDAEQLSKHKYVGLAYDRIIDTGVPATAVHILAYKWGWNDALDSIAEFAPTVDAEPVRHGHWIKMSDADGIYYVCSECGNELPRVIDSFDPQFDLFPKLKCIDKTTYCPHCGTKMENANDT